MKIEKIPKLNRDKHWNEVVNVKKNEKKENNFGEVLSKAMENRK
jgi:hypothetical protein